jgi:hypothetical protein
MKRIVLEVAKNIATANYQDAEKIREDVTYVLLYNKNVSGLSILKQRVFVANLVKTLMTYQSVRDILALSDVVYHDGAIWFLPDDGEFVATPGHMTGVFHKHNSRQRAGLMFCENTHRAWEVSEYHLQNTMEHLKMIQKLLG